MVPIEIGTTETLAFVLNNLSLSGVRVLEVGCGDGLLALRLLEQGARVRGIDVDCDLIEQARGRGVDAVAGDFLHYADEAFDAILFSRSLHHLHTPAAAMEKAHCLLKPQGCLLVEDFAVDAVDQRTAVWNYGIEALLQAAGLLAGVDAPPAITDALKRWQIDHTEHHDIADSPTMRAALRAHFEMVSEARVPYLYRYFLHELVADEQSAMVARQLLDWERELIACDGIEAVGLRWVAVRR